LPGLAETHRKASVSFDAQGLIFATATPNNVVKLFDLRSYDKGPFATFHVLHTHPVQWAGMKFSPDGKLIAVTTLENTIFLIDAFTGERRHIFQSHQNNNGGALEASFSPDAQYLLSGSEDGTIHVWDTYSGEEKATWRGHAGVVGCVQWNPKMMMAASADFRLVFWAPKLDELSTRS